MKFRNVKNIKVFTKHNFIEYTDLKKTTITVTESVISGTCGKNTIIIPLEKCTKIEIEQY